MQRGYNCIINQHLLEKNNYMSRVWFITGAGKGMGIERKVYIEDYDCNRWQDDFVKNNSHNEQPGDSVRLSELIYEVSNASNPPLHLPVGEDAVNSMENYVTKI